MIVWRQPPTLISPRSRSSALISYLPVQIRKLIEAYPLSISLFLTWMSPAHREVTLNFIHSVEKVVVDVAEEHHLDYHT